MTSPRYFKDVWLLRILQPPDGERGGEWQWSDILLPWTVISYTKPLFAARVIVIVVAIIPISIISGVC